MWDRIFLNDISGTRRNSKRFLCSDCLSELLNNLSRWHGGNLLSPEYDFPDYSGDGMEDPMSPVSLWLLQIGLNASNPPIYLLLLKQVATSIPMKRVDNRQLPNLLIIANFIQITSKRNRSPFAAKEVIFFSLDESDANEVDFPIFDPSVSTAEGLHICSTSHAQTLLESRYSGIPI